MKKEFPQSAFCISIFKDGTSETSKTQVTQAWINMINKIEKNKNISAGKYDLQAFSYAVK